MELIKFKDKVKPSFKVGDCVILNNLQSKKRKFTLWYNFKGLTSDIVFDTKYEVLAVNQDSIRITGSKYSMPEVGVSRYFHPMEHFILAE